MTNYIKVFILARKGHRDIAIPGDVSPSQHRCVHALMEHLCKHCVMRSVLMHKASPLCWCDRVNRVSVPLTLFLSFSRFFSLSLSLHIYIHTERCIDHKIYLQIEKNAMYLIYIDIYRYQINKNCFESSLLIYCL